MNFSIAFTDDTTHILTGSTFAQAILYSKGVAKQLSAINIFYPNLIVLNSTTTICFGVFCKNISTQLNESYNIFTEDIEEINSWILTQPNLEIQTINKTQKTLV